MKKKLTLAIAAYVLMVAGILTYIYCPRTVIKNTAMWYEKDFTIPVFCKTVKFKQLYDIGLYDGQFEVSKKQAANMVNQLNSDRQRYLTAVENSKGVGDEAREQLKKTTKVYNLTRLYSYDSAISSFACDVWEQVEKNMMDKTGKIIGYYVTGTKLFAEDFEDGEDIDIVPKNFILIYKNLDDKYYICIKRWAYRDWDYTLREWEFKEKELKEENKQ